MSEHLEGSARQSTEVPFPPSWIDRLIVWVGRLPGPGWLYYLLGALGFAVLINAVFWIDGSMPFGSFEPMLTGFGVLVVYWLGLYQYLSGVGSRSLKKYRPLLDVDDSEFARIEYELAKLPRWLGWLAIPLGFGFAAASIVGEPAPYGDIVPQTAVPYVGDIVITGFLVSTFFCFLVRSIRQLRMVHKLHARATDISLLNLESTHAFSALTARTGTGFIFILVVSYFLDPAAFGTSVDMILWVLIVSVSIASFAIPVMGMRDLLEEEKERALHETSDLLQATSASLHSKIGKKDYDDLEGMETAINALIHERELLQKISTWPWDPRTLRGFASALLLPIFLWLVTRLLERLI